MLDKQEKIEYPTYAYVRRYLSTLRYYTLLYVRLKYLTYVTLRLTLGCVLFAIVLIGAVARFVATSCHSYVRRQAGE